jgi:hypothetical protein
MDPTGPGSYLDIFLGNEESMLVVEWVGNTKHLNYKILKFFLKFLQFFEKNRIRISSQNLRIWTRRSIFTDLSDPDPQHCIFSLKIST